MWTHKEWAQDKADQTTHFKQGGQVQAPAIACGNLFFSPSRSTPPHLSTLQIYPSPTSPFRAAECTSWAHLISFLPDSTQLLSKGTKSKVISVVYKPSHWNLQKLRSSAIFSLDDCVRSSGSGNAPGIPFTPSLLGLKDRATQQKLFRTATLCSGHDRCPEPPSLPFLFSNILTKLDVNGNYWNACLSC